MTVLEVPVLVCDGCGVDRCATEVLRRLLVILDRAIECAEAQGLTELQWAFTATGSPDVGGLPAELRDSFGGLQPLLTHERDLAQATQRAAGEQPDAFH